MNGGYRIWNDAQLIEAVKTSYSLRQVLIKLNLAAAGGNYANIKKHIAKLNLSTSHWLGQGWNLGRQYKDISEYSSNKNIKNHLIAKLGRICNQCKLTKWLTNPIPLELHHKDGDRLNGNEENLELLCPNCHALTDNWRGRALFGQARK